MQNVLKKIKPAFEFKAFSTKSFSSLETNLHVFLQRWFLNSFEILIQPLLYFLAFGFGLEKWIPNIGGMPYHEYVFFGIVAATAMSTALYEGSQGVYEKYLQGNEFLVLRTCPVSFEQVLFGEFLWSVFRSILACSLMMIIGSSIDVIYVVDFMPLLFSCLWLAIIFSSLGLLLASLVDSYGKTFQYASLIVIPLLLFSGVFYPLDRLPVGISFLFDVLPLHSAIEWVRNRNFLDSWALSSATVVVYLVLSYLIFNIAALRIAKKLDLKTEEKL
jgi:lipooligosaccharide transport system permease protein